MKLKLLDLFSGIGGFSLGLESTGYFETIGFVEKDEFCQKTFIISRDFINFPYILLTLLSHSPILLPVL